MWNENRSSAVMTGTGVRLESPLVGAQSLLDASLAQQSKLFRLRERPFLELVNVRGDARDGAIAAAVHSVIGTPLPTTPNTVSRGSEYEALWLGPDEWLVRPNEARTPELEGKMRTALGALFASVVDVGSGYTVLEASGERVRDVISRGCPLDLHPKMLQCGQCAQSHFFKASIVLIPTSDDTFEIIVRRSFADYFCRILLDAAAPIVS
ncbi:sarcosine oxidase subunit gamma [Trinickia dabaoshanensis]|uniref:Sarcosine oxidase subunit gamma n=1 Tax=Trinickia dabaoshanensis TaxID=564714 RepID=A0A2N7VXW8_9BURK|nr:sarcosine oxidase subunit gamma [Trinickia dabaoshanensis]PMS21993.1 sarcosine oxidase subunit gamma [Trinickia dabaoshanensis]